MSEKPPLPLTYASAQRKGVRRAPMVGFLVRTSILLILGLFFANGDLLTSPRHSRSFLEWTLRLLPLWILLAASGVILFRTLRNRNEDRTERAWNADDTGRVERFDDVLPSDSRTNSTRTARLYSGTLGINSGTFSGMEIGCAGAVAMVLFCVIAIGGLVAMVWWTVLSK